MLWTNLSPKELIEAAMAVVGTPPPSREIVFRALFDKFLALSPIPFVTVSRKVKMWNDVPAELQPALFMTDHTEKQMNVPRGLPNKATWDVMLFIYAKIDEHEIGSTVLNNLLDSIDAALRPEVSLNVLTLDGLVYSVYTNGEIRKDPGDLDGQAIALMPVSIRPP